MEAIMTVDIYLGGLLVLTLVAILVVLMTSTKDTKHERHPRGSEDAKS
jgi:hypothetical protein